MGKHVSIYSSEKISEEDFVSFVREAGCHVLDDAILDLAYEAPGRGRFWIYEARRAWHGDFESPYGDGPNVELDEKLGGRAQIGLPLHLSSEPGSADRALEFASKLASRWPVAVDCAALSAFSASELRAFVEQRRPPVLLGSEVRLWMPTRPDIRGAIDAMQGLVLAPEETREALRSANLKGKVDSETEVVEGFFQAASSDIWVISSTISICTDAAVPELQLEEVTSSLAGQSHGHLVRVLSGWGAPDDARDASLTFANRLLEGSKGVLTGTFDLVLSPQEILEWASAGRGWRIR